MNCIVFICVWGGEGVACHFWTKPSAGWFLESPNSLNNWGLTVILGASTSFLGLLFTLFFIVDMLARSRHRYVDENTPVLLPPLLTVLMQSDRFGGGALGFPRPNILIMFEPFPRLAAFRLTRLKYKKQRISPEVTRKRRRTRKRLWLASMNARSQWGSWTRCCPSVVNGGTAVHTENLLSPAWEGQHRKSVWGAVCMIPLPKDTARKRHERKKDKMPAFGKF